MLLVADVWFIGGDRDADELDEFVVPADVRVCCVVGVVFCVPCCDSVPCVRAALVPHA